MSSILKQADIFHKMFLLRPLIISLTLISVPVTFGEMNISNFLNLSENKRDIMNNCLNSILTKYMACGTLVTFVNSNIDDDQTISAINSDTFCHGVTARSFYHRNWFIRTDLYVITAKDPRELSQGLWNLKRDTFWNPRVRFIVQMNNLNAQEIQEAFEVFLKYKIYSVILLNDVNYDTEIYSYNPFNHHNCGKRFDAPIMLGTRRNIDDSEDLFTNTLISGLKNCTIKVVAIDDVPNFITELSNFTIYGKVVAGLEQFVLENIASRVGFNIEYKVFPEDEPEGIVLPNGTATGILKYIDAGEADIAAGGYELMLNRVEMFDFLWGFNYGVLNVFTPVKKPDIWKRVYREFGTTTWVVIASALCVAIIVCITFSRIINDRTYSTINLWGYFYGNQNRGLSRDKRFRFFIFWWVWFTFFISSFYITALYSLITLHIHETPHALSVGNLKTMPYKPCISDDSRAFFLFAYNQSLPENEPPIHKCTYTDGSLDFVASSKHHYAIEMSYSYTIEEYKYLDEEGNRKLDSWIFSSSNAIVMYLARGFPFRDQFQKYGNNIFESGLLSNHLETLRLNTSSFLQRRPKFFKKTSLTDIRMHFFILVSGYGLSFVCFLLEIWYHYSKNK